MNSQNDVGLFEYEAEENLLGSILIRSENRDIINQVSQVLKVEDFKGVNLKSHPSYWGKNALTYYAMLTCENTPHAINVVQQLVKLNLLFEMAPAYMAHLTAGVWSSLFYMDYAKVIKENSILRQAKYYSETGNIKKLSQITQVGFKGGVNGL